MSKRNIRGKSGKQLYLNQLFLGGMKYTSSEMTEGVAKVISNYDISPTGDSAMPRTAFTSKQLDSNIGKYFYPIKFNQSVNEQHYIEFVNTISEEDYVNDIKQTLNTDYAPLKFYSRTIGDITDINKTLEGHSVSDPSGTEDILENLFLFYSEVVKQFEFEYFTGWEYINDSNYRVTDGDTYEIFGDTSYFSNSVRLLGIDAPETKTNDNFSAMATKMLMYITDNYMRNKRVYYQDYGKDKYNRQLLDVYFPYNNVFISLSEIMVRCGLAKPAYFYDSYPTEMQLYEAYKNAKNDGVCLHSDAIDPFLTISKNKLNEDGDYSHTEYRYEFVKTTDTKAVNSLLSNTNDTVQFQYIDYLDSVAVIGRILSKSGEIVYKGLMYIKPVLNLTVNNDLNFCIEFPPNGFEGEDIDIVTAQETGYNLLNSNLIDTSDSNDKNLVAGIKGLIVTDQFENSIIMQATKGQPVKLHAIMNYGYVNSTMKPTVTFRAEYQLVQKKFTDKYEIEKDYIETSDPINISGITGSTGIQSLNGIEYISTIKVFVGFDRQDISIINNAGGGSSYKYNSDNGILTVTLGGPNPNSAITGKVLFNVPVENRIPIYTTEISVHKIDLLNNNSYNVIAASSLDKVHSVRIRFTKLEMVCVLQEETKIYDVTHRLTTDWQEFTADDLKNLEQGATVDVNIKTDYGTFDVEFEPATYLSVQYKPEWDKNDETNFYTINYLDMNIGELIKDDESVEFEFTTKVFAKWEKAKYGTDLDTDAGWVRIPKTIEEDKEVYTIEDNTLTPISDNPEDIDWVVDEISNVSLKYTIYFRQYLFGEEVDTITNDPIHSKTYDITLAMPLFKIGPVAEFLDQEDILNNVNIKNATRLGIFNRQLYLYGPYTKSNFIQFSMFEEQWYLPFPYYNIEIPEPIVYVYPYLNSLVVFGKYNIYMLTGGVGVLDLTLHKIYENLSITAADVNLVNTVGTNLMFFNNNIGYLMVPNTYSDDPTNIKVYKLTDNISNALLNPEPLIKALTNSIDLGEFASTIFANYSTFVDSNVLYIVANYTWQKGIEEFKSCIMYRYNQTYKYWNLYYSPIFIELSNSYIAEPQLGVQYITVTEDNNKCLTFLNSIHADSFDVVYNDGNAIQEAIETYLDTGYLSVDTMNDKRFKDIIIEFDNIKRDDENSEMNIHCNFFIDGTPMLISEVNNIQIEDNNGDILGDIEPHIPLKNQYFDTELHHISSDNRDSNDEFIFDNTYGVAFKINESMYTNVGRTHVRIPVFGKGRLPSFTLRIVTKNNYEFINYSLIYKEKNINRRR